MRSWFTITPLLASVSFSQATELHNAKSNAIKINSVIMKCASVIKRSQLVERSGGRSIFKQQRHHFIGFVVTDTGDNLQNIIVCYWLWNIVFILTNFNHFIFLTGTFSK